MLKKHVAYSYSFVVLLVLLDCFDYFLPSLIIANKVVDFPLIMINKIKIIIKINK